MEQERDFQPRDILTVTQLLLNHSGGTQRVLLTREQRFVEYYISIVFI